MAKKKISGTKKSAVKKKTGGKKKAVSARASITKKTTAGKVRPAVKPPVKKTAKKAAKKKASPRPAVEIRSVEPSTLDGVTFITAARRARRGGSGPAGQSGDLQGLSGRELVDSESVAELVEEGQFHEAEVVSAVENAPDPDQGEVRTREVLADDVPEEYTDTD